MLGEFRQVAPQMGKPAGNNIVSGDIIPQFNGFTL
jgi:hypothetical protein